MRKTKKLALMSVLAAIALGIFALEAQLPSIVPVPGVKLGLANIITLTTMMLLGRKEAGAVFLVRVILGAMFAGSPSTLIFSFAGGLLAYGIMCALIGVFDEGHIWIVSALAAIGHNAGQLLACVLVVKTPGVFAYAPILVISGIITGIFTGFAAMYLVRALKKLRL